MATAWILTKGMTNLRNQFNKRFPKRSKVSDGTIGNLAHQLESASSHNPDRTGAAEWKDGDSKNEVRAFDVTNVLNDNDVTFEQLIQFMVVVLGRQLGILQSVVRYVIYNRRIWRASTGWATESYTGASAHTEHAHFTGAFTNAADENDTFDFRFDQLGIQMDVSDIWAAVVNPDGTKRSVAEVLVEARNAAVAGQVAAIAEVTRDATQNAMLSQIMTMLTTINNSAGTMTTAQMVALQQTMRDAAAQAGADAASRVEAGINSLRIHLGDDGVAVA